MTVDIVACFYRQEWALPALLRGVEDNKESVDRVFIVNDEPWSTRPNVPSYVTLLDHPHVGHGVSTCFNQGARASSAGHLLFMATDEHFEPGLLARFLGDPPLSPRTLRAGGATLIDRSGTPLREAKRSAFRPWLLVSNFYVVAHEDHDALGGFDEAYSTGYGYEDYDYGLRWVRAFGPDSIEASAYSCRHFASASPTPRRATEENRLRFYRSLQAHFGREVSLFAQLYRGQVTGPRVAHEVGPAVAIGPADVFLDCLEPVWLPPGLDTIETTGLLDPAVMTAHLTLLREMIAEDGIVRVYPPHAGTAEIAPMAGFTVHPAGDCLELTR